MRVNGCGEEVACAVAAIIGLDEHDIRKETISVRKTERRDTVGVAIMQTKLLGLWARDACEIAWLRIVLGVLKRCWLYLGQFVLLGNS